MNRTPNQQRASNISQHICVTAGAGSGKTTVLVDRYLKILQDILQDDVTPRDIVAITFTEKAAAEMKGRVIENLKGATDLENREQCLEEMNIAPISTIHAFCSRILREFPFQAGVPANFGVLRGIDQTLLLRHTIKNTLQDIATNTKDEHHTELHCSLQRYGNRQKLTELFSTMVEKRDAVKAIISQTYRKQNNEMLYEFWNQQITDKWINYLFPVLDIAKGKNAAEVNVLSLKLKANVNPVEGHILRRKIAELITTKSGSIAKTDFIGRGVDISGFDYEIKFLESAAENIKSATPLTEENDETDDQFLISTTDHLLTLYHRILNDYQNNKLSQGKLDFEDLQLKTRDLLKSNDNIRQKLVERYKYYMVDEYQDTNELQYELVMLLTNDLHDANLFIVGDPKQSIFGFRGADVRVFEKTKQKIDGVGENIQLQENFRSLRDTVGFVNYFFKRLMGDGTENEFEVQFEPLTQARASNGNGAVEILLGQKGDEPINEYTLIAQHIKKMITNNEEIWVQDTGDDEFSKPIEYGDISILIRSRRHLPEIEHALLSAGIPYLTTGGVGFYQRQEIYDIWNYLSFLNAPQENDTALIGILRSPAFGISDTELYKISRQNEDSFWKKVQKYLSPSEHLTKAIVTLKHHMQIAHRMSINQLILTIVNETGMIGTLKLGEQGQQKWANYQKLLELARNFDGDEDQQTLTHFIDFLDILITEEPREGQAPIEDSSGAVQIMTIHSAKGKQFPVVILPSLNRQGQYGREPFIDDELGIGFSPHKPEENYTKTAPEIVSLMKDHASAKDEAEKKRLFYVGATRARDRLILSGSLNEYGNPENMLKWLDEYLGIGEDADSISLPVTVEVYLNENTMSQSFQLQIPIIRQLYDTDDTDKVSHDTTPVDFPQLPFSPPKSSDFGGSFSVLELANYARCPLRYQLEHVLRIPPLEEGQSDWDETEMDTLIRRVLAQIKHTSDLDNPERLITNTLRNFPDIRQSSIKSDVIGVIRTHINNFRNTELAQTLVSTSDSYTNHQIHANINGHIISGRIDRLYRDQVGGWQGLNYITFKGRDLEYYKPEVELYSLLLSKVYPNEPLVTINYIFTEQSAYEKMCFSSTDLLEISEKWQQKIISLQQGNYKKNLEHCCSCPYADSQGNCIVTES